jgi:ribonucleoside-diphosphate reductase alpha chain
MSRGYLLPGETVQERVRSIGDRAEFLLKESCLNAADRSRFNGYSDKFVDYMAAGYYSLASPIWSNFGRTGLPISCNGVFISDTMASILEKFSEIGMQTKYGAGTSAYLGAIRPRGSAITGAGFADGPLNFAEIGQTITSVISQGAVRRGNLAVYLDVDHPDIEEWLTIREEGSPIQTLSYGVCLSDSFMTRVSKREREASLLWLRILRNRAETGYPYLFFSDNANHGAPQVYKDKGMRIWASNLCTEIMLASSEDSSFVCDLSSMDIFTWENWREIPDSVEVLALLLDAVMSEYITKTDNIKFMEASNRFARTQRALGIGTLGYHSYLQSINVAFESEEARAVNEAVHSWISDKAAAATSMMAELFGEPELLVGTGNRNVTMMAIAPTTSSSFIKGAVSPSIEPLHSNYFTKDLAKGKYTYRNPELNRVLTAHVQNTEEVWSSILVRKGSVQHLDFLSSHEKDVFKTFGEISQLEIVIQAADRQGFIDQAQSLNLMIHPKTPVKDVSSLYLTAWQLGLKSLYYQHSTNPVQELVASLVSCTSCEA